MLNLKNKNLTVLDHNLKDFFEMDCSCNKLTTLPTLHDRITRINCSKNNLNSLPVLPSNLVYLNCSDNPIETLPILPSTLRILDSPPCEAMVFMNEYDSLLF